MAVHLHSPLRTEQLLGLFVIASLPATAVGIWNLGYQILVISIAGGENLNSAGLWLPGVLGIPADPMSISACVLTGLVYFAPLLMVAMGTTLFWATIFARVRNISRDPGWLMTSWLFVLLVPPSVPLIYIAIGLSFGVIVGAHIFGGTGRYLVSPALLSVLFLLLGYPEFAESMLPLQGSGVTSSWAEVSTTGFTEKSASAYLWGREIGAIGTSSVAAIMAGCAFLIFAGAVSWRIVAGGFAGLVLMALLLNLSGDNTAAQLPWYWHIAVGNFCFILVFLATDPSAIPLTRPARWTYGVMFGALTIVIRILDPNHPEASLTALLLAALSMPLMDFLVVKKHLQRSEIQ